jgi:DNA-binding CsgD family transcriptional regulator
MARTEFYNDWLRPQEIDDCLATTIMNEGQPGILVFAVPTRVGNFNADAVRLVKLLVPHLQAAFRTHKHLYGVALQRDGALEALDRLGRPVLFTDGSGRFSLANSAAERLLAEADGLMTGSNGMLHAATRQQTTELHRLIAVAGGLADGYRHGGSMLIDRPSGEKPLLVTVIPLPPDGHAVLPRPDTGVLVLIAAPTDDVPVPARALQALFGLTPTEANVAQAITRGKGLKAAANTLGIAPSTAKTHLLRVFAKTGTTRQAELVDRLGHLVTAPIER